MCGNDGLQQVSGLFFPGMDTIPLRSLHAKGGVGRTQKTTYDFNSNERVQSSECTAIVLILAFRQDEPKTEPDGLRNDMNITGILSRRCFCRYVFTRHVTTVFAI